MTAFCVERYWAELIGSVTGITLLRHTDGDFGGAYGAARLKTEFSHS